MSDLTSRPWIIAKGVMFAVILLMSGAGVMIHEDRCYRFCLLLTCLWSACRFYYFLFYVLERYVGIDGRYAGIIDLCQRLWRQRKS